MPRTTPALAVALLLAPAALHAQAVETPEPFDSLGRVQAITPAGAARLELRPPAWRVTGDFEEARLYRLGPDQWVVAVRRRTGEVERYSITAEERAYLRARASSVPPATDMAALPDRVQAGVQQTVGDARTLAREGSRVAFVRNHAILGVALYAPSFAAAVTDQAAGRIATYLAVAGGSFFGAAALSREMTISPEQNRLSTMGAVLGGASGLGLAYAAKATSNAQAAGVFVGSLAGAATGLYLGRDATPSQVDAATFGVTAGALTAGGLLAAAGTLRDDGLSRRTSALVMVTAGVASFPLGARYPQLASYNVTSGDVYVLYATGALGALAAGSTVAGRGVGDAPRYVAATAGFLAGVVAGDRVLVKRFDHTMNQAALVGLGTGAGALMGAGVSALLDGGGGRNRNLLFALMALGGAGGIQAVEYFVGTPGDAGRATPVRPVGAARARRRDPRLRLEPLGAALAGAGVRGAHTLGSISF